jgi:uncharacterized protein YjbI with pentapeptide repeats
MANKEHLRIIHQGVNVWNQWRVENPSIHPDLIGADLKGVDLKGADLSDAQLNGAMLMGANLHSASLVRAILIAARLSEANLIEANLSVANLIMASLMGADLSRTRLLLTNLCYADLTGAKLESAYLESTIFGATTLSEAEGLDSCEHLDRSIMDYETLARSYHLPLSFLRGCGLPEKVINDLPSLLDEPIQFYSCFISYSSKNQDFAEQLYTNLQNRGVRCWFAPEDLRIGERIRIGIEESIRKYDKLLLILSRYSVTSDWVEKEVETALEEERIQKRIILFPIRLDDTVMKIESGWAAAIRRTRNIGDFRRWKIHDTYQRAINRLIRDLKAEAPFTSRA